MPPPTDPNFGPETDPSALRQAIIRRLPARLTAKGEIALPALPGLVDHYVEGLKATWGALGRHFTPAEFEYLRKVLGDLVKRAFDVSPSSRVLVAYETDPYPKTTLSWQMVIQPSTLEDEYADWVAQRTPPLFGHHPDAKVMDVARSLGAPGGVAVLDAGAGTGRNTIPLAKEGFRVDAVEMSPALAAILRRDVEAQGLPINLYEGDILDAAIAVPHNHYHLLALSEVAGTHFLTTRQVRLLFEAADRLLVPGGLLLFDVFMPKDSYEPDAMVRAMGQAVWSCLFTQRDLQDAASGLPFDRVSDESALEYEKAHLPPEQWPPTGWYEAWAAGQDIFDLSAVQTPVEMRWITYRKRPA